MTADNLIISGRKILLRPVPFAGLVAMVTGNILDFWIVYVGLVLVLMLAYITGVLLACFVLVIGDK